MIGWLVGKAVGFPPAGRDVPVMVRFTTDGASETWTRTFGSMSFTSRQTARHRRSHWLLVEHFGPFAFAMALSSDGDYLRLIPMRWSCLGVPLPLALAPFGDSYEVARDGRFNFHVEIRLPLVEMMVAYRGWLEPVAA